MAPTWAHLGPSWAHLWPILDPFWAHFSNSSPRCAQFLGSSALLDHLRRSLSRSWAVLDEFLRKCAKTREKNTILNPFMVFYCENVRKTREKTPFKINLSLHGNGKRARMEKLCRCRPVLARFRARLGAHLGPALAHLGPNLNPHFRANPPGVPSF